LERDAPVKYLIGFITATNKYFQGHRVFIKFFIKSTRWRIDMKCDIRCIINTVYSVVLEFNILLLFIQTDFLSDQTLTYIQHRVHLLKSEVLPGPFPAYGATVSYKLASIVSLLNKKDPILLLKADCG
jgi:hypothetical protein